MSRYRSGTITIEVEEFLDEVSDDALLEECSARKLTPAAPDETVDRDILLEAYEAMNRGAIAEARSIIDRLLFPKWKSVKACETEFFGARR